MTIPEQHHSGGGDNVAGDKIMVEIKSLAPVDLIPPIDMVFESLRKKDNATAKTQMNMLKAMAQRDPEAAALVEVISIYGGLVDAQGHGAAWTIVAKIISTATNHIVKDVCLAALLKLSSGTDQEDAAREFYEEDLSPGPYAREAYLRFYADKEQLEVAAKGIPTEGELTGIVEGAVRLQLTELLTRMAKRLDMLYASYNSKALLAIATGSELNLDLARCHFWLNRPEVKERLDDLAEQAAQLLEQSKGTDARVQDLACSIFNIYQDHPPGNLFETLKKYLQQFDPTRSEIVARFKALVGGDAVLNESQRNLKAACEDPQKRTAWCRQFLAENSHTIEEIAPFLHLATPSELGEWLDREQTLDGASEMEDAYTRLFARIYQYDEDCDHAQQRHELGEHVDNFVSKWESDIASIAPAGAFELAEKLFAIKLPHKALSLTSRLIPEDTLWPSRFVVSHLKCLLETEQYKTFDNVIARVKGAEESITLLSFQSIKAERMGDIVSALESSDLMVQHAPDLAHAWYRGCYIRARYRSLPEQQAFQQRMPDAVLQNPTPEVVAILGFLTKAGNFKRAEPLWLDWFIQDPRARSVDLVNFHFGTCHTTDFDISPSLDQCAVAVEYEQEGNTQVRLIVEDDQGSGECTLKSSSQLGQLLKNLPKGESANMGMITYKVRDHLPPYVGCLRIALRLRHIHNDGSDCFAMMEMPSDPSEFVPYLEEKMAQDSERRKQLEAVDAIPLYMRGRALYPSDAFKGALNCWTDVRIPKSPLWNLGETDPSAVVLDAYSIGYLATTDLAQRVLDSGISFVLPAATKEALKQFIDEISDDKLLLVGVTDSGRLFRTTASDVRERDAHTLKALRLIWEKASVAHPTVHDAQLEVYSIKEGIDATVYDAMQISISKGIPWFCMDSAFAALHHVNKNPITNVESIILQAVSGAPFNFERMRHGFLLYAVGALPFAFTFREIYSLASIPNPLAGFILFRLIQNHGRQIFVGERGPGILLDTILKHLHSRFAFGLELSTVWPSYTPWTLFTTHVFNHGLNLYLSVGEGSAELRLAQAMKYMSLNCGSYQPFLKILAGNFVGYIEGHFMDMPAFIENFQSISS